MKYIKCKKCNHYNPLSSEFLIFCDVCGQKIDSNFKDWKKVNTDKTFQDFVNLYGVDEVHSKTNKNKFTVKKGLQILAVIVCVVLGAYYGGKQSSKMVRYFYEIAFPVADLLDKEWGSQTFSDVLTIETPFIFEQNKTEVPLKPEIKKLIKNISVFNHFHSSAFGIIAMVCEFDASIGKASLKGASDNAIAQVMIEQKGKDLFFNDQNILIDQYPAILKTATFINETNDEVHYKGITVLKEDLTMVYLTAIWTGEDESYTLLIDRMLESMQVN